MDEKIMMREQERFAQKERKKRNRKKLWIAGSVVLTFGIAIGIGCLLRIRKSGTVQESAVSISAGAGQEIVYAELLSVRGNEITYRVVQESEQPPDGEAKQLPDEKEKQPPDEREMQPPDEREMQPPDEREMQLPDEKEMQPPDEREKQLPDEKEKQPPDEKEKQLPDEREMQSPDEREMQPPDEREMQPPDEENTAEAETITVLIPVGCKVTTKLGTVTTFARLAAGDRIALVMEKSGDEREITAVYIVE